MRDVTVRSRIALMGESVSRFILDWTIETLKTTEGRAWRENILFLLLSLLYALRPSFTLPCSSNNSQPCQAQKEKGQETMHRAL